MIGVDWSTPAFKPAPFLVCGMPRCRTTWISAFLSYDGAQCVHEPCLHFRSLDDIERFFASHAGASDSPMTFLAHEAKRRVPELKIVTVWRPLDEIKKSARERGLVLEDWFLEKLEAATERVRRDFNTLHLHYADLETKKACAELFEYCLEVPFDGRWWRSLRHRDIQSNIRAALRAIRGNDALRQFLVPAYA